MTWKEFKEAVERFGVKDDEDIGYIDVSGNREIDIWWAPERRLMVRRVIGI